MAKKNIILKGGGITVEREGSEALTPGWLLEYKSDGKFQKAGTAGKGKGMIFAIENDSFGKTVSDNWALGDRVIAMHVVPGSEILIMLPVSQTIVVGDLLTSNADGKFKEAGTDDDKLMVALEAKTTTSAQATERIRAVVIA